MPFPPGAHIATLVLIGLPGKRERKGAVGLVSGMLLWVNSLSTDNRQLVTSAQAAWSCLEGEVG